MRRCRTPNNRAPQKVYTVVYTFCLAAFFAAGFFVITATARAQGEEKNLVFLLENVSAQQGLITADVVLKNDTSNALNNVMLFWMLEEPAQAGAGGTVKPGILYAAGRVEDDKGRMTFSVLPNETVRRSIVITAPEATQSSENLLTVFAVDPFSGRAVTDTISVSKTVLLQGGGALFFFDSFLCTLRIGTTPFFITPIFRVGEQPRMVCQISSPFSEARTITPVFHIGEQLLYQSDGERTNVEGKAIAFSPFETKIVDIEIPFTATKPQQYETAFFLKDADGKQISPITLFRWVVQGPSAALRRANFDKDGYVKGETATLDFAFTQSADLTVARSVPEALRQSDPERWKGTALQTPRMSVIVRNGKGKTCGNAEEVLPPLASEQFSGKLEIPITRNCVNPAADVRISEGNQELTAAIYRTRSLPATAERLRSNTLWYVLGGALFVTMIVGVSLWRKNRHPNTPNDADDSNGEEERGAEIPHSPANAGTQVLRSNGTPSGKEDLRFVYPRKDDTHHDDFS